jgi:hypothetical protein
MEVRSQETGFGPSDKTNRIFSSEGNFRRARSGIFFMCLSANRCLETCLIIATSRAAMIQSASVLKFPTASDAGQTSLSTAVVLRRCTCHRSFPASCSARPSSHWTWRCNQNRPSRGSGPRTGFPADVGQLALFGSSRRLRSRRRDRISARQLQSCYSLIASHR